MIAEADTPAGVVGRGLKCDTRGRVTEDVHQARLDSYRADPTWTPEAEAADRFEGQERDE